MTDITNAEWQIMKVLWANGECTAQFLFDVLGEAFGWKISTVKTLITRLVKKEYIQYTKVKREYHYYTLLKEEDVVLNSLLQDVQRICLKKQGAIISKVLDCIDFDEKTYLQLFNILKAKKNVYKFIECNCLQGQCCCKKGNK